MNNMQKRFDKISDWVFDTMFTFAKTYHKLKRSHRRWIMQNKNGQNKKKRRRTQVMLRGRGCRVRTGVYSRRGPGRTRHGQRG